MKIVVTGATGFLGRLLAEQIADAGHYVIGIAGPSGYHKQSNISLWPLEEEFSDVAAKVGAFQPDFIVHCANQYIFDHQLSVIDSMIDANIRFGLHLLESVAGTRTHFINFSSFFQTFEERSLLPNSVYAILKQCFSDIVMWYGSTSRLSTTDLVLYDVFGPGDSRDRLIPKLFAAAKAGREMTINSPDALMNLCHVKDVISAVDVVFRDGITGRWALRSPSLVSVSELVAVIQSITGMKLVSGWGQKRPSADPRQNNIQTLPGWLPTVDLKQGLQDCWNFEISG